MPVGPDGLPLFYPPKVNGWSYYQSSNPKNDDEVDWPDEMSFPGNGIVRMEPDGPTDFGVGKNIGKFNDSIGGCNMDFKATAARGYAAFADDPRDIEFKCLIRFEDIDPDQGFSLSCCTGHHTSDKCCQGFAYMGNIKPGLSPCHFRFRKEMWHVSYHDSPEGEFTDDRVDFKLNGHGWIGFGFTRYNKPNTTNRVVLEMWFNNNPIANPVTGWFLIKKIEDFPGNGWGDDGDECNGDSDQVGTWSGAQNRAKTNSTSGFAEFQKISLREIDVTRSFDDVPPPPPPPSGGGGEGGGGTPPPGGGTGIPSQISPVISYILINANTAGFPTFKPPMTGLQSMFLALSEDLAETMTDPNPSAIDGPVGWRGTAGAGTAAEGEIGDAPCDHNFSAVTNLPLVHTFADTLMVEPYWSNKDNACTLDLSGDPGNPNPPPPTTNETMLNYTVATTGAFQQSLATEFGLPISEFIVMVLGEETIETQTDPFDTGFEENGWHRPTNDSCAQIGEAPCNPFNDPDCGDGDPDWLFEYSDGFWNEAYWSNQHHNCIVPNHLTTSKSRGVVPDLVYHGGRVIKKPIINLIFWGEDWADQTNPSMSHLIDLIQNEMLDDHKDFFDGLNQYSGCGAPTFGEAVLFDESNPPSKPTDLENDGGEWDQRVEDVIVECFNSKFTNLAALEQDLDNVNIVVFLPKRIDDTNLPNEYHFAMKLVKDEDSNPATVDTVAATDSTIDNDGIAWLEATGEILSWKISRTKSDDFRWSHDTDHAGLGYEVTWFTNCDNIDNDGHTAMKLGGGNHSGDCGGNPKEGNQCCCWYDIGIRKNGDIQTQVERPHPENFDVDCDDCTMTNIGMEMDEGWIGLKIIVHPETDNGDVEHGGIRIKFYISTDAIVGGVPTNDWKLVFNTLDTGQWMPNYDWPDYQELEMRLSGCENTSDAKLYKDKVFMRRWIRGSTGSGGGGEPIPPCDGCRITYHGGRIMKTPLVHLIFWGQAWNDRAVTPTKAECISWFKDKLLGTDKAFFNNLNQYGGISYPIYGQAVTNLTYPVPSAEKISEEDGRLVINNTIETALLPQNADFNNTIYIVFMPIGHILWHPQTGVEPDATHDSFKPVLTVTDTGGVDQPTNVIVIQGAFTLKADINVYSSTACSLGTSDPGGGGSGGVSKFYDITDTDGSDSVTRELCDDSTFSNRTRIAQRMDSGSPNIGKKVHQADVYLEKIGSPAASPTVAFKIWNSANTVVYTSTTTIAPNTGIPANFNTPVTFDCTTNTHAFVVGDRAGVEYTGTDDANCLEGVYTTHSGTGSNNTAMMHYENGAWETHVDRNMCMTLWE